MLRRRSLYGASGSQEVIDLSYRDIYGNDTTTRNTANCYVVRENGSYKIPLIYGNGISNGAINTSAYDSSGYYVNHLSATITTPYIEKMAGCTAITPCLAWCEAQDVISDLEIINGNDGVRMLAFNVSNFPALGANAIIGILDSSGDFIWSWHIWLYGDELYPVVFNTNTSPVFSTTLLNVNLGWTWDDSTKTCGKSPHFQWGRKDAMLSPANNTSYTNHIYYGEKTFDIRNSGTQTVARAIAEPYNFFYYSQTRWASDATYKLWINSPDVKGIYDPCPVGFRVPKYIDFYTLIGGQESRSYLGSTYGTQISTNAVNPTSNFFFYSGRRFYNGAIEEMGALHYWTASLYRGYEEFPEDYEDYGEYDFNECHELCTSSGIIYASTVAYISNALSIRPRLQ